MGKGTITHEKESWHGTFCLSHHRMQYSNHLCSYLTRECYVWGDCYETAWPRGLSPRGPGFVLFRFVSFHGYVHSCTISYLFWKKASGVRSINSQEGIKGWLNTWTLCQTTLWQCTYCMKESKTKRNLMEQTNHKSKHNHLTGQATALSC